MVNALERWECSGGTASETTAMLGSSRKRHPDIYHCSITSPAHSPFLSRGKEVDSFGKTAAVPFAKFPSLSIGDAQSFFHLLEGKQALKLAADVGRWDAE